MSPSHDDLLVYLDLVHGVDDLLAPPPVVAPWPEQPWWTWQDVAENAVDRGLERWAWGLTAWGREAGVCAALGVLDCVMPLWEHAVIAGAEGTETVVENAARGFNPSPSTLHADLAAWGRTPTSAAAEALFSSNQGDHLDLFDFMGTSEFKERWHDNWMFALTTVYAAALIPGDEDALLPRHLGNAAISCRRALATEHGDAAPVVTFQLMATRLRTWSP